MFMILHDQAQSLTNLDGNEGFSNNMLVTYVKWLGKSSTKVHHEKIHPCAQKSSNDRAQLLTNLDGNGGFSNTMLVTYAKWLGKSSTKVHHEKIHPCAQKSSREARNDFSINDHRLSNSLVTQSKLIKRHSDRRYNEIIHISERSHFLPDPDSANLAFPAGLLYMDCSGGKA